MNMWLTLNEHLFSYTELRSLVDDKSQGRHILYRLSDNCFGTLQSGNLQVEFILQEQE